MYQIKCDDFVLYDPRIEELMLLNPKCKLAVNTVGGASFTILAKHPYYDRLKKLKSIVEISQDGQVIFRGRITNDSKDFHNKLAVDVEGVLAFANDSIVAPFNFPVDFPEATESTNIVEYFLRWVLDQHNAQVEEWKQLKLGTVSVTDPNNNFVRSSEDFLTTWEVLKSKLFESNLGGYLVIRYEDDGNYIDYVTDFDLTNPQRITFGKNLLDLISKSDANETYSAILPIGSANDISGKKTMITLSALPDGDLTDDLAKEGLFIYSKSARAEYGWICVPPSESKWNDVTDANNLQTKAMEYLTGTAMLFSGTITIKAVDLSFSDEQIQSFRIGRNILVDSTAHELVNANYPLTQLDIDIFNPQNTVITLGDTVRTLVDINKSDNDAIKERLESSAYDVKETVTDITEIKNQLVIQNTQVINDCTQIIMSALESYVETSNLEEYKETVSTQMQILSDEILMNFSTVTEHINVVDGDAQSKFTEIYKYISFADGNITLGSNENAITLTIENDMIVFKKNGLQFGWWDGVDFHTGNIVVEVNERAQFGNFAFIPRSDGSLMFLKVGG